jgi:hypothetical protein
MDEFVGVQVVFRLRYMGNVSVALGYVTTVGESSITVQRPMGDLWIVAWDDLLAATGFRR